MAKRATRADKKSETAAALALVRKREGATPAKPAPKPKAKKAPPPATAPAETSDRPLRLEWVQARTLTPNPANWRTHPERQLRALRQTMGRVGWAGALLFNEATGRLLDGHGRLKLADPDEYLPVLVGSWSEQQEREILATLDPIAAMARADETRLNSLLAELEADGVSAGSGDAIGDLLAALPELVPLADAPERRSDEATEGGATEPGGAGAGGGDGYEASTKILLTCRDGPQQESLIDLVDRLAAGETIDPALLADAFAGVESRALNG